MFQNLHFRSISVSQFLLSKKLLLLFVLFYSFGTSTYAQAPGKSLNFDGVDDWAPIPLTDYYAGNFTIETWIKTTSTAIRSNIVSWGNNSAGIASVCEFRLASGKLQIVCNGATGNGYITSTANVNTGKWTHVAVVKYGTTYSLYINGVMDGLGTITYSGYNFNTIVVGGLYYASAWAWDAFFPGSMDEMRFWNVARSQGDLAANMYSEMSTPVTGLDHYYKFNSSTGTLMQDEVSGGANLTIYNFALTGATSNWVESYAMVLPKAPITSAITNTGFTASWTAPTTGVVTNYLLDVATDSAFTNLVSGYSAKNVGSVLTTNITGLAIGTTYYWRVRADKTSVTGTGANTAYQTVTTSILPPGNSLNFDGSNDYVNTNTPVFAALNGTVANFTMECWVKPNVADNDGGYHGFLGGQIAGGRNPGFWMISNKIHCSEQGIGYTTPTAVLNQDKWNHVAWVKMGANNILYVNGIFAGTWTTYATCTMYANYTIGYIDNYFSGDIDEVRFWSTSLSQSAIQANMYNEISPSSTGLLHYYKFNSGSGTVLTDAVTTGTSNGTLNNLALSGTTSNWLESYAMVVPTTFTTTNATATSFTANWAAPVAGSVDNYLLDVSTSPSFDTMIAGFNGLNVGLVTTYNVTGLTNNSANSYYWRVRANKTSVTGTAANPLNGAIAITATPPGNALSFDGSNDYVNLPDRLTQAVANSNNSAITIEYWFKGSDVRSAVRFNDASNYIIAGWGGTIGTQYHVLSNDGGTSNGLQVGAAVTDGKWHHVAMTWERNTTNGFKSYLDGQIVAQRNSANTALPNITAYGYLGIVYYGSEATNGLLDEVRIYNVARTQANIQADMYSTATTSLPAGLLAYYKMDQGTAGETNTGLTTLFDQTTNANSATMYNFALTGSSSNWVESYAEITPTNLSTSNITVTGFTANWAASTLGTATSYVIDVATDTAFANIITNYSAKNVGNVFTTNITGLANGTTYYWRVRADKTSVTGTGNNAAYQTTTTIYQKPGQALNFDGSNDFVGLGTSAAIIGSGAFAVEAWVKTTSTARGVIIQQRDISGVAGEYLLELNPNGTVLWQLYNTAWETTTSALAVNDGKWHHIAATRESDTSLRIYIDGKLAASKALSSQTLTSFYVAIGKDYRDNAGLFNGNIDEVRIWNTARTQAQLQASMYDEISPSTTGLVHYYSFNATSGTTLTDAVTTGTANGTLTNFTGGTSATSNWVESYAMVVPTTFTSTNGTTTGFTANWAAPAVGTVESYKLDVSPSANFDTFVSGFNGLDVGLVTTYAITGLTNTTNSYYWRVRANKTSVNLQGANAISGILGIAATPPGNALSFDGSNDYVNLPDRLTQAVANSNNSAITIEYWFKGSDVRSAVRFNDASNYIIAGWGGTIGTQYHVLSNDGGTSNGLQVGAAVTDGKWHHVAMTWERNTTNGFKSYLDGQLVAQRNSANVALPNLTTYGYLGIVYTGGEPMNGSLDEVRMYNVARSQAEIQADMFSTATTSLPAGLLAYYKMDQGIAGGTNTGLTTLFDQTTNANSATMYNFALTGSSSNWVESYAEITPTNVTTTNIAPTSFTANWAAATLGTATSYVIDVATDTAFANLVTNYSAKNVGNVFTTTITGLANTTTYYWRVRADKTSVTGTGNNTAYQTVTTTFQKPGKALNFDGSNDYVNISNPTALQLTQGTVETWIRNAGSANYQGILVKQNAYGLFLINNMLAVWDWTTGTAKSTGINLADNLWHHVAVSFNSGVTNGTLIYIDGILKYTTTITILNQTQNLVIGSGTSGGSQFLNGSIDEARIWNTIRTQAQIQSNMYDVIAGNSSGLVAYYKFDNNSASAGATNTGITNLSDETSNAFNGTLTNFALTGTTSNWVESYAMVVPTALNTTAINYSGFTANWTAPVPGTVENYLLDVATDAAFTSMVSGYNALNIGTVTTYTLSNLDQGITYYWRVRASKASVLGQAGYAAVQTVATPQEALNVSSTTTTNTFNLLTNTAAIVDPNVLINYTHNITGFSVVLSNGKQNGDVLSYTGTLPSGISATAYNSSTGVLSFTGTTTPANWQTLLRTVTFRAYNNTGVNRSISFSAGSLNSFTNGHFYELVTTASSWTNSKAAAANKKYLNYTGYLATVITQKENDYIKQILTANAWMGATDEFSQINLATGATTYANQGASEGKWFWVTGPEAGTQFMTANGATNVVAGKYANWYNVLSNEPNNSSGTEHYGQFYSTNNGTWNDLPDNGNIGYVVEYGGMANDIVQTPSYTLTMSVTGTPPGNALSFDGTNDYIYTPTQISNPTTFTLEAWFNTTAAKSGGIVGFNADQTNTLNSSYDRLIWMSADGKINFSTNNGAANTITSAIAYNDGKYHHVAGSYSSATGMILYIDGVLIGTNAVNSISSYSGYWKIGGFRDWANYGGVAGGMDYFNGKIDEVRIWSTVRTLAEIQTNMLNVIAPTTTGLSYYYNFDQGIPSGTNTGNTTLYDQTTSANNGTMSGFALSNASSNWVESYAMVVPITATTTAITYNGFTANWSASTIGIADNYLLDISTNAGFTSFVTGFNNKNVGTSTSFTVTGLSSNSTYYWRVRADKTSVTGQGGYSTQTVLTSKEPINITSTTTSNTFNLLTNSAVVVDSNLTVNYSQNIDGFRIIITTNKQDGDLLSYTGTLPSGVTPVAYNASTGVLAFTGATSAANWQAFLRTVTFRAYKNSSAARSISFSAGSLNSFSNGHFYELVTSVATWANAKTAAAAKSYLNYTGYLTTVTSADENVFVKQILSADAWMGASDDYSFINAATGTATYSSQSSTNPSEGKWYWVTGPEAGTQFMTNNGSTNVVTGKYANWLNNVSTNEPNNGGSSEHYGQFYSTNNGTWNDLNSSATLGYLIEYGGLASDIVQTPSYSVTMNVAAIEPGNALNFDGTNDYVNIGNKLSFPNTTPFTIETWVNRKTASGGIVVSKHNGGVAGQYYIIVNTNGTILFHREIAPWDLTTTTAIPANKWTHIAATYNGTTMTIYINGVASGSMASGSIDSGKTADFLLIQNSQNLYIGAKDYNSAPTDFFGGKIDEVRFWSVARSQAEIVANMITPLSPSTANILSYYNFNEGITDGTNTGLTTLYDQTATLNNGTLNGFGLSGTASNWVESYAMVVPKTTAATSKYSLGFTANWTASSIGTTEKYYLDVATDAAFTSLVSDYSNKDVGNVTSFAVNTGLSANTTYYYRVRAEKNSVTGTGGYSNSTSVTTNAAETLVATAASNRTSTSFTANWSEPTLQNISSYTLDVSTNSAFTAPISGSPFTVSGLSQNVTSLTPDTTYYYRIRVSGYNNSNTITTNTSAPFASISSNLSNICLNGSSPTITFTGSGSAAPYTFTYTLNGGSNQTISTTSGNSVTLLVPTSSAGTNTYSLVNVTDADNGTNAQGGSAIVTVNVVPTPSFVTTPASTICSNVDANYLTESGQTNYVWTVPGVLGTDYTITSGSTGTSSSSVTLKWLTSGSKTVTVKYANSFGCEGLIASNTITVNSSPVVASITGVTTTTVGLSTTLSNTTVGGVWSSSDATKAAISTSGVVTAIDAGTVTISYTVTSGSCTTVVNTNYIVNPAPVPTITAVSPTNPVVGATITVTGTNFNGASIVTVGTYHVSFTVVSATSITFILPAGTGSNLPVAVTTPGGTATSISPNLITYNTAGVPTITSFSPTSAGSGQTVIITGANLTNPSSITFGGTDVASYTVNSATQITVVIGSGTSGTVSVTTAYPTPASKTGFTYLTCAGNPTLYSGGSLSMCASDSPFNITTDANASNYSALTWSTSGTGTFVNNSTADALTNTQYVPSSADITAGSVTLSLTATANSGCMNQISSKTLVIYPSSVGGNISGSTNVCTGTNASTLTLTANVGVVTKWQSSTSSDFSTTITDIANTTNRLIATNLTTTTYYRAVVTSGSCSAGFSDVATITVNPISNAGTISGATTVCSGTNSTVLTLNGSVGTIQWQSSSSFGGTYSNINGATSNTYNVTNLTATTYYRAVVTSGVCSSATTTAVAMTVNSISNAGSITGATSVCSGTNSTVLTLNGSVGTMQWQSSSSFGGTYSNINGATSNTYNVTNLTATTYYRAVVTSGVCSSATTTAVAMTVNSISNAGSITGATSVCSGTNSTVLTLNGSVGTMQWQSSSSFGGTYSNIVGAISATYTATNLSATTYYKAVVISGVCSSATTTAVTITVNPRSSAAIISGTSTICLGSSANLQVAITGGEAPFTIVYNNGTSDISVSNYVSGSTILVSPTANTNYSLVSVTSNNGCIGTNISGLATVSINSFYLFYADNDHDGFGAGTAVSLCAVNATTPPTGYSVNTLDCDDTDATLYPSSVKSIWIGTSGTTWADSGNWKCGNVPTSTSDVTIASGATNQPVIISDIAINSLTIETGMSLTVPTGFDLTVTDFVHNNGTMTVQNNANLIQTNDLAINTGAITVKRDSSLLLRLDHVLWSSPVTGNQTLLQLSPNTLTNRFYTYTTLSNSYTATSATSTFTAGKGYAIRTSNTHNATTPTAFSGTFVGVPNNGLKSFTLATNATNLYNYNLVGNPYPSTIDVAAFLDYNPNINGTVYFYTHSLTMNASGSFPEGTNYSSWNRLGHTVSTHINGDLHPQTLSIPNGTVQVGQGFIVRATNAGTVSFTNDMRRRNNDNQFLRTAEIEKHRIWLNLKTDTGSDINQMMVGYVDGATQAVDTDYDGLLLGVSGSSLASKLDGANYGIQGRSLPFASNDVVPLAFKASAVGNYMISLTNTDGLFAGSQDIFVRDNLMGTDHNIKVSPYTFTSDAGTFDSRFELVYTQALGIPSTDFTPNSVIVYKNTDWFHVNTKGIVMKDIQVYDVAGRLIYKLSDINATTAVLRGLTQTNEVLFLKITSVDNVTVTVKVIN